MSTVMRGQYLKKTWKKGVEKIEVENEDFSLRANFLKILIKLN